MGVELNGTSQYLSIATALATAAPFTMACWMRPDSSGLGKTLMCLSDTGGTTNYFRVEYDEGEGDTTAEARDGGTTRQSDFLGASATYENGNWHHAAGVYASSTSRLVYVNGVAGTLDTNSSTPTSIDSFAIGVLLRSSNTQYFDGGLAEVGFWNVALSAAEVLALSKGVWPGSIRPEALVAYWPLRSVSNLTSEFGGFTLTNTASATTTATHPKILYPQRNRLIYVPAAAPPATGNRRRRMLFCGRA